MTVRFGVAGRMLPLILMASLIAGCGQEGRQAAEASNDATPAGSPSAESSSVGAFVAGSRICIINQSSKNLQTDPIVYKEGSNTTSVDPGNVYCQAGYSENGRDDTDLRAISGPTKLHIFATYSTTDLEMPFSSAAVTFIDDRETYERWVIESISGVGAHEKPNTPDGRFALDLYRVDDSNGWKQWKLEIFGLPPE